MLTVKNLAMVAFVSMLTWATVYIVYSGLDRQRLSKDPSNKSKVAPETIYESLMSSKEVLYMEDNARRRVIIVLRVDDLKKLHSDLLEKESRCDLGPREKRLLNAAEEFDRGTLRGCYSDEDAVLIGFDKGE
jgi:hypothetical protein